jgi:hypothetical protein
MEQLGDDIRYIVLRWRVGYHWLGEGQLQGCASRPAQHLGRPLQAKVESVVCPKGAMIQRNESPKAAHMGDGDPAKPELRKGHSLGNNNTVPPVRICRRVGFCMEGEDRGEYLW